MEWDGFRNLFLRAQAGEVAAREQLLALVLSWLQGRVHGVPQAAAGSSDLVQDIVVVILRKLHQCEGDDDDEICWKKFRGWVARIACRHRINHFLRIAHPDRNRHLVRTSELAADPSPSEQASLSELVQRVAAEVRRLDRYDRRIVEWVMDGGSLRQLALELGKDATTLQKHFKHKILPRLERALGDHPHASPES